MLYHFQVGFPASLFLPTRINRLVYTEHALRAAETDRYGNFRQALPGCLFNFSIVEVESHDDDFPTKVVVRARLTTKLDICMAIQPIGNSLTAYAVRTVWLNESNDNHATLNKSKYAVPA